MNRSGPGARMDSIMNSGGTARWEHYVLLRGARLSGFWAEQVARDDCDVLFVMGRGFDPRMTMGLTTVLAAGGSGVRDVVGLELLEGPMSASLNHQDAVEQNWKEVVEVVGERGSASVEELQFWSEEGRRVSSQSARDLFGAAERFVSYSDVIIDVSSMPRGVYFPLIARVLYLLDHKEGGRRTNLHVFVAEDAEYDATIHEEGIDEKAEFVSSFGGGFDEEGTPTPKVWMPMLGEGKRVQFDRIQDRVKPDEICPVLPSPARNPRRADDLVLEYQRQLFDELHLDGRSFLHVSELNPFEVYRRLRGAVLRYSDVFGILGGCRVAISPMSSKLMSLGALLAAYELKARGHRVGVAHVDAQGYRLQGSVVRAELCGLWLCGECDGK